LRRLESLSFDKNYLETEILSLLLDFAKRNPNIKATLKKLVLKRNYLGVKTSKRLLDLHNNFEFLEHVDISNNKLDEKEIQWICNVIHYNPRILCYDVRGNPGETKRVNVLSFEIIFFKLLILVEAKCS
jgi:hypothetical protein